MDSSSSGSPRETLPAEANKFVGRSSELKQLTSLLTRARMVTLTGAGGAGKTRLAVQVARRVRSTFPDGVAYISLADLKDDELLGQLVAEALDLHGSIHRWTADMLVEYLADSRRLLVFDNCEHMVGACAELVDALLSGCPQIHMLATSREPLAVDGEHTFPLLPLRVPVADCPLEAFAQYDAVGLFVERAASVVPTFQLNASNHRVVAELCRTLDGLPLALELAAVRLRALSLEQIVQLLSARPDLLDGGRRGGPTRQRTLSASMGWSYDLCSAGEQLLWERVSVFSGGVELAAAEGICCDEQLTRSEIMPLLTSLVDKSILIREELDGRVRYRLLETVRQFGLKTLGRQPHEVIRWQRRHRDWYLDLIEEAMSDWRVAGHADRLALLRNGIANLRVALEFCLEQPGESTAGLRMAGLLYHYWLMAGLLAEGDYWLDRFLAAVPEPGPARLRGLWVAASLAVLREDAMSAGQMLEAASAMCDLHGDDSARAGVLQGQGLLALNGDETDQAAKLFAASVQKFEAVDDVNGAAIATAMYSLAVMLRGESDRVAEAHARCQQLTMPYGVTWVASNSLWIAGMDAWNRDEVGEAFEMLTAALRLKRPLQNHLGTAECLTAIAWVTATSGKLHRAAVLLGAAERMWRQIGMSADTVPGFSRHREVIATLARKLGERPFQAAQRQGRQMTVDESIAFALEESAQSQTSADAVKPTKREREIAELVARGRSNQEIADELVLSRRTVEAHVQHLLAKLEFGSRSQIAAWVAHHKAVGEHSADPEDSRV